MNKSKSSKCAALAVASSKTQSKLLQMSADIVEVKSSNNGTSAKIVMYLKSRALKVEGDKVSSMTPLRTIGEIMDECRRSNDCPIWFHMNSENGPKIAKVTGAKPVRHHGNNALELAVSAKDLTSSGATAIKATSFSDLQEEKDVTITWYMMPIIITNPAPPGPPTLYALLENDEKLSTLEDALKAADLDDNLDDNDNNYTFFAPFNTAFAKLPSEAVQDLFKLKNKGKLEKLLKNHVVEGKFDSAKLQKIAHSADPYIIAIAGRRLQVRMHGHNLYVGEAKVVDADNKASNGLFHIIDAVLA